MKQKILGLFTLIMRVGLVYFATISVYAAEQEKAGGEGWERTFETPPDSAKPWTYWMWMNGNISKEGITADLEYLKRVGVGGVLLFNLHHSTPPGPIPFLSGEWVDCFSHAVSEANRLGLELGMHNGPGWTGSGGPWVRPEDAMKKLTWCHTRVGAGAGNLRLEQPESLKISGTGLSTLFKHYRSYGESSYSPADDGWYRDIAVLAWPNLTSTGGFLEARPRVTSGSSGFDGAKLLDRDQMTQVQLSYVEAGAVSLMVSFDRPFTARSLTLWLGPDARSWRCRLFQSADGETFAAISSASRVEEKLANQPILSHSFAAVTARHFKIVFERSDTHGGEEIVVSEIELSPDYLLPGWPQKAGYARGDLETLPTVEPVAAELCIAPSRIIDLTSRLRTDGTLDWEVPAGEWSVLRLGYTLSGWMSKPAPAGGRGLEVDKLSQAALGRYFNDGLIKASLEAAGAHTGKAFSALEIDSYEAGAQNWTAGLEKTFLAQRGYDPTPFLPALTGQLVESAEATERFLFDFRRLIADMFADNYYGHMRELAHCHGLTLYGETYGMGNFDNLQSASRVDVPMDEFWSGGLNLGGLASAAHTSGKSIVAAEAFTTGRDTKPFHPATLKVTGDRAFCAGINRFVIHASAHQPWLEPGMEMNMMGCGINFRRNQIWAEQARGWVSYLTRCQYLLQEGRFVADVLRFVGEGAPAGTLKPWALHDEGRRISGCSWDACGRETVLELTVDEGELALPSGMRYRLLVLPETEAMSLDVALKVRELVQQGATVLAGHRPVKAVGLRNRAADDLVVDRIGREVWGAANGKTVKQTFFGKGRLFSGMTIPEALNAAGIGPDFEMPVRLEKNRMEWIHRYVEASDTHLYFVANPSREPIFREALFRITGYVPELWNPMTGRTMKAPVYREEAARTAVLLDLQGEESVFVVFRRKTPQAHATNFAIDGASTLIANGGVHLFSGGNAIWTESNGNSVSMKIPEPPSPVTLGGEWAVSFVNGPGAPAPIVLKDLISWTDHPDGLVKYFSGTGVYTTEFDLPAGLFAETIALYLDLGKVHEIAELQINGLDAGLLWMAPFRIKVTPLLRPGRNTIEVRLTNLPVNRQIGDAQFADDCNFGPSGLGASLRWPAWLPHLSQRPQKERLTFSSWRHWEKDEPLRKSGLLGPVRIHGAIIIPLQVEQNKTQGHEWSSEKHPKNSTY